MGFFERFSPSRTPEERAVRENEVKLAKELEQKDLENALLEEHVAHQGAHHAAEVAEFGLDALTGALTRKAFEEVLSEELAHVRGEVPETRKGEPPHEEVALLFIDLDHFKQVNDTQGHAKGDEALKAAARVFMNLVRHETDKVGRLGGDEFAIMLPGADHETAMKIANNIRVGVLADSLLRELGITTSIGVSTSKTAATFAGLTASADQAMYKSKQGGRNQVSG